MYIHHHNMLHILYIIYYSLLYIYSKNKCYSVTLLYKALSNSELRVTIL